MHFLLDEMFPGQTTDRLRLLGHDASSVRDLGLGGRPDPEVAAYARASGLVLVTENVKDFVAEREVVIVVVLKAGLPAEGMAHHLAERLAAWALAHPQPYVGLHWG